MFRLVHSHQQFEGSLGINILRGPPDSSCEATTFLRNKKSYCPTRNTVHVCLSVCMRKRLNSKLLQTHWRNFSISLNIGVVPEILGTSHYHRLKIPRFWGFICFTVLFLVRNNGQCPQFRLQLQPHTIIRTLYSSIFLSVCIHLQTSRIN
jgi:hypothetical protein